MKHSSDPIDTCGLLHKDLLDEMIKGPVLEGGHECKLTQSHVKSARCWIRLSRRCSKAALQEFQVHLS